MYSHEELEAAGLLDFRAFLCHVWAHLALPKPTRIQLDIARWLQKGPRREIIQAFRGVGKSWITVAFVLWVLLLDPEKKIMVVSASENLATDFTTFCKQLIDGMPVLQHLKPRQGTRDRTDAFDVGVSVVVKDPSVKSVGITGQLTGSRADLIIADDIEVPKNSYTHLLRERVAELVKEFDSVLKPDGRIVYLGTPQVEESLYLRLENRGYVARVWPAEIPANLTRYRGRLAPVIQKMLTEGIAAGTSTDPERFTLDDLNERRASNGITGYNLQFMLDTTASDLDRKPLKLRDLIVHDTDDNMGHVQLVWGGAPNLVIQDLHAGGLDGDAYHRAAWMSPEMAKYTSTVMAIDPSGKGKDETGYAVLKFLSGLLYLVDVGGFTDGYDELTLRQLAGKALRWGVNSIIIEENYGGGMFNKLLEPHLIRVFGDHSERAGGPRKLGSAGRIDYEWNGWSSTQKEARILDTLEPIVQSHRLVVSRRVIEEDTKQQQEASKYSFVQQFTRLERVRGSLPHEDRLECVAMAAQYFVERMNKDAERSLKQHQDAEFELELKRFAQHVFTVGAHNNDLIRS